MRFGGCKGGFLAEALRAEALGEGSFSRRRRGRRREGGVTRKSGMALIHAEGKFLISQNEWLTVSLIRSLKDHPVKPCMKGL